MVNVMRIDHSLQVFTFSFYSPPYSLMNDNVVKNHIKHTVASYADGNCDKIWIIRQQCSITKEKNGWRAEHNSKQVVPLQ